MTKLTVNEQRGKTRVATRERHAAMRPVTRELKLKPTPKQAANLELAFKQYKWVYNHTVSLEKGEKWDYTSKTVPVKLPDGTYEERELSLLGSHPKQDVLGEVINARKALKTLRANGRKSGRGKLKFKREKKSIPLKSCADNGGTFRFRNGRVQIQKIPGWFKVLGLKQLEGLELASGKLVKKPSGYYLHVTGYEEWAEPTPPIGKVVGVDLGIATHLTLSTGLEFSATVSETERLKRLQRKLSRQVKGSSNHGKTRVKIRREYEKMGNRKDEMSRKIVHYLLQGHDAVAVQDDNLNGWKIKNGKTVQHSVLGRVKASLARSPKVSMVDRYAPTTQSCPKCHARTQVPVKVRFFVCSNPRCNYVAPRDLHASGNMLVEAGLSAHPLLDSDWSPEELGVAPVEGLASAGIIASQVKSAPVKQETMLLSAAS